MRSGIGGRNLVFAPRQFLLIQAFEKLTTASQKKSGWRGYDRRFVASREGSARLHQRTI
jgi:hypothetical protein